MSLLAKANLVLFATLLAHTVDHAVNQPARDLPATGTLVGVLAFAIVAASAVLALQRRPSAAAGAFSGLATVAGIVAIHLTPSRAGAISDPYWDFDANPLSWTLMVGPLVAGAALAVIAMRELRAPRAAVGT